ncbi:MAG: putative porin [Armatimonadetes bacterium]|nr:putative porin [Armatimonadota bacterium]
MRKQIMTICGLAVMVLSNSAFAQSTWTWGGDVRARYDLVAPRAAGVNDNLLLRARINATGAVADGKVKWGVGLATGTGNPISRNVMLAGGDLNGNLGVMLDLGYVAFTPNDRFALTLGKMKNPFWASDMIFDPDLTPEGLAMSYQLYGGSSKDLFTNVKSTTSYYGVRNAGVMSNDAWMLGEQITATLKKVDLGFGVYYYSRLTGGAVAGLPQLPAAFPSDNMAVLHGRARYAFSVGKFPLVLTGDLTANVVEQAQMMAWEARADMPKFLGNGSASLTYRQANINSLFSSWADSDFGSGAGYRSGLRFNYNVPLYKDVTLGATYMRWDRHQALAGAGVGTIDRFQVEVSTKF